jgi:hypothetical protein
MLAASLLTFALTRLYTRLARHREWGSGRVGDVHVHHMVLGNVLMLTCGMLVIAFQPTDFGLDLFALGFGVGAAFVLDEFALTVHLRDVYWTPEGRHSIEMSIIWTLLGYCCSPASRPSASTTRRRSHGSSASASSHSRSCCR